VLQALHKTEKHPHQQKKSTSAIRHAAGDKDNFISVNGRYQNMKNLRTQPAFSTQPTLRAVKSEALKFAVILKCVLNMKGSNTEI